MFPPAEDVKPQIRLRVYDAKTPFPKELHGTYDLVHAHHLVAAMVVPPDWTPLLLNLLTIVKPGGYIQWEEPNFYSTLVRCSLPTTRSKHMPEVARTLVSAEMKERVAHGWNELPALIKEAGLDMVVADVVSSDRVLKGRRGYSGNLIKLFFGGSRLATEQGTPGAKSFAKIDRSEKQLMEEIESGSYCWTDIHSTIGRKPS